MSPIIAPTSDEGLDLIPNISESTNTSSADLFDSNNDENGIEHELLRRSSRVKTKPQWLEEYVSSMHSKETSPFPESSALLVESTSNNPIKMSAKKQYRLPTLPNLVSYALLSQHNGLLAN